MTTINIIGWGFLCSSWMCTFLATSIPYEYYQQRQRIHIAATVFAVISFAIFITALLTSGSVNK